MKYGDYNFLGTYDVTGVPVGGVFPATEVTKEFYEKAKSAQTGTVILISGESRTFFNFIYNLFDEGEVDLYAVGLVNNVPTPFYGQLYSNGTYSIFGSN